MNRMKLHLLPPFVGGTTFRVVVESPRGSAAKLKFDPTMEVMTLSRPLTMGVTYPFDWGFIPGTAASDGDPLDAMLLWDTPTFPGVVIPCRALGVVQVDQRKARGGGRERNDRVVAIPLKAPRFEQFRTVRDVPRRIRRELEEFFVQVTALEGKDVKILGWTGPEAVVRLIKRSTTTSE